MPFLRITVLAPSLAPEQIRRLQQGATELMTSIMRKKVDGTAVLVEHVRGGWSIGGRPASAAAQVDVTIGAGTNGVDEKATLMAAMWRLLGAVLGPQLHEATYIVVHEIDIGAYGRGGLTRAERDRRDSIGERPTLAKD